MIRTKATFMKRSHYSVEFKEQALSKARERGGQSLQETADMLNLNLGTLKGWLKEDGKKQALLGTTRLPVEQAASNWSAPQRLQALHESYNLHDQALFAWCREKGLFEHQLRQWHGEFCQVGKTSTPADAALRQVKQKNNQLESELRRKDKALAETAALLVLQKKFQTLWEVEA